MTKLNKQRPGFRDWVDKQTDPKWGLMPLTHITKGIGAEDIIRDGKVDAKDDDVFKRPLAYFFYGRPAYRVAGDGVIKVEAACPYCFIFYESLIQDSAAIHAFDTGAFFKRMYKHILLDEMDIADFSLETDVSRPNKLIARVFKSKEHYLNGDLSQIANPEQITEPYEFHARAYMHLLASPGRNEPDDRICSIEITFGKPIELAKSLRAIVTPHTLWGESSKAPWLTALHQNGIEIAPYLFVPGRHPEHYHAALEAQVLDLYRQWGVF